MSHFYAKITPILVIINFLCSVGILLGLSVALEVGIINEFMPGTICTFLFMLIMNLAIIRKKKKHSEDFSITGYVIFVLVLPCVVPLILKLIIIAFNCIMNSMGFYYSIV